MAIASVKDIADAFAAGRVHTQRFTKNAGIGADAQWQDWSYAAGQPGYDARIGDALTLTPVIAAKNDAIWFPDIEAGQERRLIGLRVYCTASGADQINVEYYMYDLLAVYPLIDGDSTDTQVMDNTLSLPRYASGEGVMAVLVNHVAPALGGAAFTINYTNNLGNARVAAGTITTWGAGKLGTGNAVCLPLDARCRGIRTIDDITFTTAPGGLWCIYLIKPITPISWRGGVTGATNTVFTEKCLCFEDAFRLPRIFDGAHLGFFYMPNGGGRTVATFGSATFIWG